jgi:hypothetical protein
MMCREQKTAEAGWSLGGSMEGEVPKGARSIRTPETTERDSAGLEALGFPNVVKRYEELRARTQRLQMLHATH